MIIRGRALTDTGMKFVRDIEIGDKVFSHSGEFKRVIGKSKKIIPANSVMLREHYLHVAIDGEIDDWLTTADHEFLVKRGDVLSFVHAYDLKKTDYIAVPRIQSMGTKGSQITLDMAWFLGLYSVKGVIMTKDGQEILGSCLPKEMSQEDVAKFCRISGQFGATSVDANFDQRIGKYWVHMFGDTLVQVVKNLFHSASYTVPDHLPIEFHEWTLDQKNSILIGRIGGFL